MKFRILGGLEAEAEGKAIALGGPNEQKALAVLLLNAGRVVPVASLVDMLWDGDPPATAIKQAQNAVGRLRSQLRVAGEADLIVTERGGYRLQIDRDALDARVFEERVARARAAAGAGELPEAAALLRDALDLWHGAALTGLSGQAVEAAADAWNERWCAAREAYHDHLLALGEHRQVVSDLRAEVRAHPLREKPAAQLMLALYRSGRPADALSAYSDLRERLAESLGLDPGPELRRLHQQVLTADPALALAAASPGQAVSPGQVMSPGRNGRYGSPESPGRKPAGGQPHRIVPRQLPAAPRHFTGRAAELRNLDDVLRQAAATDGGTVVISAIDGTAGVGKTALAVHWAHKVAERFPDGQLYVNLRGFDPAGSPVAATDAIRGFLDAFEVPAAQVPGSLDAQAGLYRSVLAGKRILVLLDNARDAAHVRPLLPGSPGCLVVVTSRSHLTGLSAADGAQLVTLDLFSPGEAAEFMARRLGASRATAEPEAAAELIRLCARLPLALSIAAARALRQPRLPLAALAAQLRDAGRLDTLDSGDAATGIRPVLSWSCRHLSAATARVFRLLAWHPGPDISSPAAASLAGVPAGEARAALAELTRANLLNEHVPGRFAFHELLRAYAAEESRACDTAAERYAATRRALDHYLHTGHAATLLLNPGRFPVDLGLSAPGVTPEEFAGSADALAWFAAEQRVLLAAIAQAAGEGFSRHVWQIPWTLTTFHVSLGRWRDEIATQQTALAAARCHGDIIGQEYAHCYLGQASARLGLHEAATAHLRQAIVLSEQRGDFLGLARIRLTFASVLAEQDRHAEAACHARQAHDAFAAAGECHGRAAALNALAWSLAHAGDIAKAIAYGERALPLHRELGSQSGEADSWYTIGYAHSRAGRPGQAVDHYLRALCLARQLGDRYSELQLLSQAGDAQHDAGDMTAARDHWHQALAIIEELQLPHTEELRDKLRVSLRGEM